MSIPDFFPMSPRRILTSLCLLGLAIDLQAQVPALITLGSSRSGDRVTVGVDWSAQAAQSWSSRHGDRLSQMGVRTAFSSDALHPKPGSHVDFSLKLSAVSTEALISIQHWVSGDRLELRDEATGKIRMVIDEHSPKNVLTPSFSPASSFWRWHCSGAGEEVSAFTLDILYVSQVQRDARGIGFNTALPCHPNAACRTDSLMVALAKSTVRIRMVMEEGIGWCSGTLVNNVLQDKTPYLLSAYHCQYNYTPRYDLWRFDFYYASETCANPANEPAFFSMTGCALQSLGQATDFLLLRLSDPLPASLPATFAGWDRSDTAIPDTSYLIHHPNADIRKLSTAAKTTTIHPNAISWTEGYTTPPQHHFRIRFTQGGHQDGSSGGPVYNEAGYLVGQLHGGTPGCEATSNTYAGRFSRSWALGAVASERLRDWLDPQSTGVTKLGGLANVKESDIVAIQGIIRDPVGRPVRNVRISLAGDDTQTVSTGADGRFMFNGINRLGTYTITPEKNDFPANGLNALDLISIQKHLLAKDLFDFPWQYIAADATNNNALAVGDILLIQRLLLGKINAFPSSPAWRFDPPLRELSNLPPGQVFEADFTAIKIGDVNHTADPQQ